LSEQVLEEIDRLFDDAEGYFQKKNEAIQRKEAAKIKSRKRQSAAQSKINTNLVGEMDHIDIQDQSNRSRDNQRDAVARNEARIRR